MNTFYASFIWRLVILKLNFTLFSFGFLTTRVVLLFNATTSDNTLYAVIHNGPAGYCVFRTLKGFLYTFPKNKVEKDQYYIF